MKIIIETIPMKDMRYQTVGDWQLLEDGTIHIKVADMGNPDYEFVVGRHELDEAYLCKKHGVTEKDVDEFDMNSKSDDPGSDPAAPYYNEHKFAMAMECPMLKELGVDVKAYEVKLDEVYLEWALKDKQQGD